MSKTDGHPLVSARITLRDVKDPKKFESIITTDGGKFEFNDVPAGKYSLLGAKRGFISADYDQHGQFSTAIVTAAGLETENLLLRLAPDAVITGKVLDEAGEPIRGASVSLYRTDHREGVDQIEREGESQTNDLGVYEISPLTPGTYYLSAGAHPWYAVHPQTNPSNAARNSSEISDESFDRALDAAYPLTYYPDVTDADSAAPIPVQGGERLQVDIHLNPVPSLRVIFRVPVDSENRPAFPRIEQPSFNGWTPVQTDEVRTSSPGVWEITGIPAGRYDLRADGNGSRVQVSGVNLTKDGEEIDASKADVLGNVKLAARASGDATLPPRLVVGLRSGHRIVSERKILDAKGEAELPRIPEGRYEVVFWGGPKPYSVSRLVVDGVESPERTLTVKPGGSPSISVTLSSGSSVIEGTAKQKGKAYAGAMVVLVPKNPEGHRDFFRRDQSDLDGTFSMRGVIAGSYTVIAIADGWNLDWSQPAVIAAYAKHGKTIDVDGSGKVSNVGEIEVESK